MLRANSGAARFRLCPKGPALVEVEGSPRRSFSAVLPDELLDLLARRRVSVAFGLRNMTHKDVALAEMQRVLKPGGKLMVLEFSKVWQPLQKPYDVYSFSVLPWLGQRIAGVEQPARFRVAERLAGRGRRLADLFRRGRRRRRALA